MALSAREVVFFIRAENQASSAIRKVARDMGGLRNLKNVQDAAGKASIANGRKIDRIQQSLIRNQEAYNTALANSNRLSRMAATGRAYGGFSAADIALKADAAASAVHRLRTEEQLLGKDLAEARLASEAQTASFAKLQRQIPLETLGRFATLAQRVSRVMRITGFVVGAAFGVAAAKAAQLQTETTLAATQARQIGHPLAEVAIKAQSINDEVLKQMKEFPASSQEMADSFYQIFSGTNVQNVHKASEMVRTFNKMAVAGGSDLKTMTDAGISLYNNFPTEFKNMEDAANSFFAAVRYGRTTPTLFANSLQRVLPIAKAAGRTFTDVADAMAFVTRQTGGKGTQADSTGLARLIEMLSNKDVIAGLEKSGIKVQEASGKMRPLLDIITDINTEFVKTGKLKPGPDTLNFFKQISALGSGGKGLSGTIQGRRIFDFLITNINQYHSVAKLVNKDIDELESSFQAMSKTPGVQWKVFTNNLRVLAVTIGEQAIPAIIELGKPVGKIVDWFNQLSPQTKHIIALFGTFGAAALVGVGILGSFASSLLRLVVLFKMIRLSGGLSALMGTAGAVALGPAVILGIIAALTILIVLLVKYPGAIHAVTDAMGGLQGMMIALGIVIAGLTFRSLLLSLAMVGESLAGASAATLLLRSRLLSLGLIAIPAIVIPIVYKVAKDLQSTHGHDIRTSQYSSNPLVGGIQKAQDALTYGLGRSLFGKSPTEAREAVAGTNDMGLTLFPHKTKMKSISDFWKRRVGNLLGDMQVPISDLEKAQKAAFAGDFATFNKIYNKYLPSAAKITIGRPDADPKQISIAGKAAAAQQRVVRQVLGRTFMQRLREVSELSAKYEKDHSLASLKKLQEARAALDKDYTGKLYQTYIDDYLSRVESADKKSTKKRLSEAQKQAKAAAKELGNAYSNIMSTYQSFLSQNQSNFGSLFSGPFMQSPGIQARLGINNNKVRPEDVLKDLHSQLHQFNRLNSQIKGVGRRGGPQSLIDQLRAAGPGALPDIEAINKLSGPQFREYVATWNRSQKAIKQATMDQLETQIGIYKKFGSKVALAIIAGIQSQDKALQSELERVINKMFPDLVNKAGKAPKVTPTGSKHSLAPTQHQTTHHDNRQVHIHNPKSENVATSTRKAMFAMKTKKR